MGLAQAYGAPFVPKHVKEEPADKLNDILNRVDDLLNRVDDLLNRVYYILNRAHDLLNDRYTKS